MFPIEAILRDVTEHTEEYLDWTKEMIKEAVKTTVITYTWLGVFIVALKVIFG
jgi:hypothetical protein